MILWRVFTAWFLWLLSVCSETHAQRIIGGQEVEKYSIKFQASVQTETRNHYCGGTLVDAQWVVSAAHCWRPSQLMRVVLSEHNLCETEGYEQVFNVSKTIIYPFYTYWNYNNDIMLIKLSEPAQLNANVQPVTLPGKNPPPTPADVCTASGWGVTQVYSSVLSNVLRAVDVRQISNCNLYYWGRITPSMICAGSIFGGKDACQGDSGGPLVCNGCFEGIVSWGIGCANPFYPGVYTKVRQYTDWIKWYIENDV